MDRGVWVLQTMGPQRVDTTKQAQVRQVSQMMCEVAFQMKRELTLGIGDPLLHNLSWLSVPLSQEPRASLAKVGAGWASSLLWGQVPSHFF